MNPISQGKGNAPIQVGGTNAPGMPMVGGGGDSMNMLMMLKMIDEMSKKKGGGGGLLGGLKGGAGIPTVESGASGAGAYGLF